MLYIQGVTHAVQVQIFNCLRSWLVAGEVSVMELAETPLFAFAFEALAYEDLFDAAVDVICELIHETQEIDDNMRVIELIVPRVIALRPLLRDHHDDADKIRGYARIFAEAGETYLILLLQHPETFFPIVEAIGECSAYPDLDIVPITFPFWMILAQSIGKKPTVPPQFPNAYQALVGVIIQHLHFPTDANSLVGQEAENFRSFRHVMGDTLKDCCYVLGTDTCLLAAYQMINTAMARSPDVTPWQDIEAPLFALRSMGAKVDASNNSTVPKIMDLIPTLPNHPRVRYAALLIISRYSEWINRHPDYIQFQLQYIAAGFEDQDSDVCAAAGQALRYICQDCKQAWQFFHPFVCMCEFHNTHLQHLVEYLPTLHTFLTTTGSHLAQDDRRQIYEAIAYIISAMPMERAAESLRTFSLDILAMVHSIANSRSVATKQELTEVSSKFTTIRLPFLPILAYTLLQTDWKTWRQCFILFKLLAMNFRLLARTLVKKRGLFLTFSSRNMGQNMTLPNARLEFFVMHSISSAPLPFPPVHRSYGACLSLLKALATLATYGSQER